MIRRNAFVYRRFGECLLSIRGSFSHNSCQRHHYYLAVSNKFITFARQNNIMCMKTLGLLVTNNIEL